MDNFPIEVIGGKKEKGEMKNILKKLHIVPNESDDVTVSSLDGSSSSFKVGRSRSRTSSPARRSLQMLADQKPLSGFSNWLSSVTSKNAGPETSGNSDNALSSFMDREKAGDVSQSYHHRATGLEHDVPARCSEMSESCDLDMEAYQIQRALKLSAEEDPEAVQIEAVKQISLGSCRPENTPAEVISYRYWVSDFFKKNKLKSIYFCIILQNCLIFRVTLRNA